MWAYLFLALGLGLSFAGNWAAAYVLEAEPDRIDLAFAGAPPVVVFGAIEVFTRNVWPDTRAWQWIRWLFIIFVAFPAAAVSFIHLVNLFVHGREADPIAWVIAVASAVMIDGLLAGCTAALLIQRVEQAPAKIPMAITAGPSPDIARLERQIAQVLTRTAEPPRIFVVEPPKVTRPKPKPLPEVETPAPKRAILPGRKRIRAQDHPLWPAWVEAFDAGDPWDVEKMIMEQKGIGNDDVTPAAARSMINRWRKTREGEPT